MSLISKVFGLALITAFSLILTACTPEVGSDKWCANMKDKPKGEWTANEVGDFTKHCLLK